MLAPTSEAFTEIPSSTLPTGNSIKKNESLFYSSKISNPKRRKYTQRDLRGYAGMSATDTSDFDVFPGKQNLFLCYPSGF